jgi:hypothetical protein
MASDLLGAFLLHARGSMILTTLLALGPIRNSAHFCGRNAHSCCLCYVCCGWYRIDSSGVDSQHQQHFSWVHRRPVPHSTFWNCQSFDVLFPRCARFHFPFFYLLMVDATVTCVWLILLLVTGIYNIVSYPGIFRAIDPSRAVMCAYRISHGDHLLSPVYCRHNLINLFNRVRPYQKI